jgi:hypothetical protein
MDMVAVKYAYKLTGSKLFDVVIYNTAKDLCIRYPGLQLKYLDNEILIEGMITPYRAEKLKDELGEYNTSLLETELIDTLNLRKD